MLLSRAKMPATSDEPPLYYYVGVSASVNVDTSRAELSESITSIISSNKVNTVTKPYVLVAHWN